MTNRRDFIKKIGKSSASFIFANAIIDSLVMAQVSSILDIPPSDYYYLGISIPGGPARWMFDLPLYKNESEKTKMIKNPMVFTEFSENATGIDSASGNIPNPNGTIKTEYKLHDINGTLLPPLWNSKFTFNNQENHLDDLAKNCIFMRGMHSLPFHAGYYKAYQPQINIPSISAISGLQSADFPIQGIQWANQAVKFNHPLGLTPISFSGLPSSKNKVEEYLRKIFAPFIVDQKNSEILLNTKIKNALDILKKAGKLKNKNSHTLHNIADRARRIMGSKIENLINDMSAAYENYLQVNSLSMKSLVKNLDDKPIFNPAKSPQYDPSKNVFNTDYPDIPLNNFFNGFNDHNFDMRNYTLIDDNSAKSFTASCYDLCFSLSIAEVLLKNKITNSLLLPAGTLRGLLNGRYSARFRNDTHNIGAIPTAFFNTKYFQAIAHSLNHFIQQIGPNLFDKTIIHLASEFSRSPRIDATGSDHGNTACQATIISGMVKSTKIVGDIDFEMTKDIRPNYNGTWGQNANGKSYKEVYAMVEEMCDIEKDKRVYKSPPLKKTDLV